MKLISIKFADEMLVGEPGDRAPPEESMHVLERVTHRSLKHSTYWCKQYRKMRK